MLEKFKTKIFMKYLGVGIISTALVTLGLIVLVDGFGMWVGIANPIMVGIMFIVRYMLYDKVGMLKDGNA